MQCLTSKSAEIREIRVHFGDVIQQNIFKSFPDDNETWLREVLDGQQVLKSGRPRHICGPQGPERGRPNAKAAEGGLGWGQTTGVLGRESPEAEEFLK